MINAKQAREQTNMANSTKGELSRLSRLIQEATREGQCYIETTHSLTPGTLKELSMSGYEIVELPHFVHYRIEW